MALETAAIMAIIAGAISITGKMVDAQQQKAKAQQTMADAMSGKTSTMEKLSQRSNLLQSQMLSESAKPDMEQQMPNQMPMGQGPQPYQQMPDAMMNPFGPQQQQPSTFKTSPDDWMLFGNNGGSYL